MEYLFACAIGPVQDFINTARRSRDLWFGSWMLSELSKAVVKKLVERVGEEKLIFPSPNDLQAGSNFNAPNKILAIVNTDPSEIGKALREALDARLKVMSENAFAKIPKDDPFIYRKRAEKQWEDLIEFYWSAVPYQGIGSYVSNRETVEALLAVRKNTRNFSQCLGAEVPKSSLDGNRESVIDEKRYPERTDLKEIRIKKAQDLYQYYKARPGERLSGVDILKRMGEPEGEKPPVFHSTSHYAAIPFIEMIENRSGKGASKNLLKEIYKFYNQKNWIVSDIPEDGALLYESRLSDTIPAGEEQNELRKEIKEILDKQVGEIRPSAYYVLLRADGDSMGKIIDAQKSPESHRNFSKKVSEFSLRVKEIVAENKGDTIYAGGDDILAYLPLHKALDCAKELEKVFRNEINETEFFYIDPKSNKKIPPTLSVGMVIAHHLDPLSEILELSHTAEKEAKKINGKNGLAIILNKRSGVERIVKGKFQSFCSRMEELIEYQRSKAISKGTAYEFQELYQELGGIENFEDVISQEATRILERKKTSGNKKWVEEKITKQFEQWIKEGKGNLQEIALEMIIANEFAKAYDMACGKGKEE